MTMHPGISLAAALRDVRLVGEPFTAPSFWTWHCVAKVISGEKLDAREAELFRQCTGRHELPQGPINRLILLAGRRAGKDRFFSAVAVWRAALAADWDTIMSAGEQAVVLLLGADKKQAGILRRYCDGLLRAPLLAAEVVRHTDDVTEFRNGSVLETATNDVRLVRGRSAIAVLGSECAHWRTDEHSASSDEEVVAAAEPSMSMCPDHGLLMLGSSVYRRRGYMHRRWKELFGNDDPDVADEVCWLASSSLMNPALPPKVIERALVADRPRAKAEYLSEWRDDISSFVDPAAIEACITPGLRERPPVNGVTYVAAIDPAGGSGQDSMVLAIAHYKDGKSVLDCVRELRPKFSPRDAVHEFAQVLKAYRVNNVIGDHWGGEFVREPFRPYGVTYELADRPKSDYYRDLLPLVNSTKIELIDNTRMATQACQLERSASRSGKELISHPQGPFHDDLINAAAIALVAAQDQPGAWFCPQTAEAIMRKSMAMAMAARGRSMY